MTLVGIHIPKCAGTTLLDRVKAGLRHDEVYQNTSIISNWREGRLEFLDNPHKHELRFVFGHHIHEEMLHLVSEPVLFTGLREPDSRLRSALAFELKLAREQGRDPPNLEALVADLDNPMCWGLAACCPRIAGGGSAFEQARRVLEACSFVYFTENFEDFAAAICKSLDIPSLQRNANVSNEPVPQIDLSGTNLDDDRALYQWARERFFDPSTFGFGRTGRVTAFLNLPRDPAALRQFLYRAQAEEYRRWEVLDEVIAFRSAQRANMEEELAIYESEREPNAFGRLISNRNEISPSFEGRPFEDNIGAGPWSNRAGN
jgi:hypothetical protein